MGQTQGKPKKKYHKRLGRKPFWDDSTQRIRAFRYFHFHPEIPRNEYERDRFRQLDRDGYRESDPIKNVYENEMHKQIALLKQLISLFHDISQMENMNQLNFTWNTMVGEYIDMKALMAFVKDQKIEFKKETKLAPRMRVIDPKTKKIEVVR